MASKNPVEVQKQAPTSDTNRSLQGHMGVMDIMFTVAAYNGPAVVFMSFIPVLLLWGNGIGAPALIIAVGILVFVVATGLVKVSAEMKRPGGFYSLIAFSLGRVTGLAAGFVALLTYFAAVISVYVVGGIAFSDIVVEFLGGPDIPWWITGLGCLAIVAMVGYRNIQLSSKVLSVFLSLELLLIVAYIVAVAMQGGAEGFTLDSFAPENVFSGSLAVGGLFAMVIFGGFEATVIFREEVRDPDKTIKRAAYGIIILITGTYALLCWVFINAYGSAVVMDILGANVATASGDSIRQYVGEAGYVFANLLLFTSAFALQLAAHNILTRYIYNLGKDKIFPRSLGSTHPKHVSPHQASVAVSIASAIGLVLLSFSPVPEELLYGTVTSFVGYGMIILVTAVCFGIGAYMLKNKLGTQIHAILIFVVGSVFSAALIFATIRFDLLSGLEGRPAIVLLTICWAFIFSGVLYGLWLRKNNKNVYANIGRRETE